MSKSFIMAGIDAKEVRAFFFVDEDGEKVKVPKAMSRTVTVGKQELTVKYRIGKKFEDIRFKIRLQNCYDPVAAAEHILSADEVIDRYDPKRNSDAFLYAKEELDEQALTPLAKEECLDRMAWFAAVCDRLADAAVLERIAQEAPKKRDGTFAKNRVTVVASCPIVMSKHMVYFELVAKPKTDTQLDVTIQERTFSQGAAQRFVNETLLTADAAASVDSDALPKTTVTFMYKNGKGRKESFDVAAVILPSGQLAIAAKPYRALADFSCVKGSDEKGYEVLEPVDRQSVTVNSKSRDITVEYAMCDSFVGVPLIQGVLMAIQRYLKKSGKTEREWLTISYKLEENGKVAPWCLTPEYTAEMMYQSLCCMEGIYTFLDQPDVEQLVADEAARKKDGTLCKGGAGYRKCFFVPTAPGREIPLVKGCVEACNAEDQRIRLFYKLERCRDNSFSRYQE